MVRLEPESSRSSLLSQLFWFLLWAAAVAVALFLQPDPRGHGTHTQLGLPPCPSMLLFAKPCPGCGMTTSFVAMTHLDFAAAWQAHPFGPPLALGWTGTALLAGWCWWMRLRLRLTRAADYAAVALALLFFGFGIARFALAPNHPGVALQVVRAAP
ncbi:MAG TPA: DUF2752 domain-containing protein [Fimbriimonadaceae bacterium]|nr:DUF2752 domain-containing protein [Fimbriimonadaceae bacterium]